MVAPVCEAIILHASVLINSLEKTTVISSAFIFSIKCIKVSMEGSVSVEQVEYTNSYSSP